MQSPNKLVVPTAPTALGLEPMLGTSVRVHPFRFDPTLSIDVRLVPRAVKKIVDLKTPSSGEICICALGP